MHGAEYTPWGRVLYQTRCFHGKATGVTSGLTTRNMFDPRLETTDIPNKIPVTILSISKNFVSITGEPECPQHEGFRFLS